MSREAVLELARTLGIDGEALVEQWSERAAIREFEAGLSREAAERAALDDLRAIQDALVTGERRGPRSAASSPDLVETKRTS